jgi:hypothetical protein
MNTCLYMATQGPDGPVKIGISENPAARIRSLQTGCPRPIELFWCMEFQSRGGALRAERAAHHALGDARLVGEWFDVDPDFADRYVRWVISEAHQ